jgi:hypothetical protein
VFSWCTKEDCVGQRYPVHLSFLREVARVYGYQVELQLNLSSIDRWTDREDMLRACALKHGGSWDKSLPYVEFSYNNNYQDSLKMAPFEALYGSKYRTPLFWRETGERQLFGVDIIREAEKQVQIIRENLRIAQSRQKSYADGKRRDVVFRSVIMCT